MWAGNVNPIKIREIIIAKLYPSVPILKKKILSNMSRDIQQQSSLTAG